MAPRQTLRPILWIVGIPLVVAVLITSLNLFRIFITDRRAADSYLLPVGFRGWTRVDYEVYGAPKLVSQGGRHLLRLGLDGRLRTSDRLQLGWASDEYYYESGESRQRLESSSFRDDSMIWGKMHGEKQGNLKAVYECFFVGAKQEYQTQSAQNPCP